MSNFNDGINELNTNAFHTKRLLDLDHEFPGILRKIANVTASIFKHFIDPNEWSWLVVEGSVTIQQQKNNQKVIKIFVDDSGKIFYKVPGFNADHAIVVGIELTTEDPFTRKLIRDYIRGLFGDHYIDPLNFEKTYLQPQQDHLYDLIILKNGVCPFDTDETTIEQFYSEMIEQLNKQYMGKLLNKS